MATKKSQIDLGWLQSSARGHSPWLEGSDADSGTLTGKNAPCIEVHTW